VTWALVAIAVGIGGAALAGVVIIGRVLLEERRVERECEIRREMRSID
jgi:hypothetical protein